MKTSIYDLVFLKIASQVTIFNLNSMCVGKIDQYNMILNKHSKLHYLFEFEANKVSTYIMKCISDYGIHFESILAFKLVNWHDAHLIN